MKITLDDKIYIVTDPTPFSTLSDICYETTLRSLENEIIGANINKERLSDINFIIFTDAAEANDYAMRLLIKDAQKTLEDNKK